MQINFDTEQIQKNEAQGIILLLSALFPALNSQPVSNSNPTPTTEEQAIFGTPIPAAPSHMAIIGAGMERAEVEAAGLALIQSGASTPSTTEPTSTKRTRRTKAQIEADEVAAKQASGVAPASPALYSSTSTQAAPADPTPASAAPSAGASGTTQSATAPTSTVLAPEVRTIGTGPTPLRVLAPTKIDADTLRALLNAHIAKHSMEEAIAILQAFGCNRVTEALALDPAKLAELAGRLDG
jgi:hypothetical protein